jgi:chromosome segregation ATPase
MTELDRPVTRRELRVELQALRTDLRTEFATKQELRSELERYATKEELRTQMESLQNEMATGFAEMRGYVDFSVTSLRDELRTHFDVVAESLRGDFRNMFDWMKANMANVTSRLEALEKDRN